MISTRDLARLLETTPKTVAAWARDGLIERASQGKYPLVASVRAVLRRQRQRTGSAVAGQVGSQRARLLKLQADRVERQMQIESGKLADAEELEAIYLGRFQAIARLMLSLPARVAGRDPTVTREMAAGIDQEVRELIGEARHAR
ncbi:MAG TPA: hypothetical protein VFE60_16680 [Roseiarcus sp.]|nr:hypothetical protein [Roseiarcus sp.]